MVSRPVGLLPIDSDKAPLAAIATGAGVLARGNTLVWFPSGHRSVSGDVEGFRPGIGVLLDHFRVPVVPTVVVGSRAAKSPDRSVPRPNPITVVFDRPLRPADFESAGRGQLAHQRITDALHDHLETRYDARR